MFVRFIVIDWLIVCKSGADFRSVCRRNFLERNLVGSQINLSRNGFDLFSGQVGLVKPIPDLAIASKLTVSFAKTKASRVFMVVVIVGGG